MNMARCLLIQSGLPAGIWAEAINTANYIHNKSPTSKLDDRSPHEVWHGNPPNVAHFQHFREEVYVLDRSPNKSKLEPRSRRGIFVVYSEESKAYRARREREIEISRDVKFLRDSHAMKHKFDDFAPQNYIWLIEDDTSCRDGPAAEADVDRLQEPLPAAHDGERDARGNEERAEEEPPREDVEHPQEQDR